MPSRQIHAWVAIGIPLLAWVIFGSKLLNLTFAISGILLVLGTIAPDYIEPAYHFTHRSFYHSQKLFKILSIITVIATIFWVATWVIFKSNLLLFIVSFPVGYIIHLLLDSTTKMGLPKK